MADVLYKQICALHDGAVPGVNEAGLELATLEQPDWRYLEYMRCLEQSIFYYSFNGIIIEPSIDPLNLAPDVKLQGKDI